MMNPAAFLLLLAAAASQVGVLSASIVEGPESTVNISSCPITFYGETYDEIKVIFPADTSLKFCFQNGPAEPTPHCLVLQDRGFLDRLDESSGTPSTPQNSGVRTNLPAMVGNSSCYILFLLLLGDIPLADMYIYDFGHQAAVEIETYNAYNLAMDATAGDEILNSWSFGSNEASDVVYFDISGCRDSDGILSPNSTRNYPDDCSDVYCDESANFEISFSCGGLELCQGNNTCGPYPDKVCTVTGSTVIDFSNTVLYIPDRCAYTVMYAEQDGVYAEVTAGFRERRRTDVSFLDHLMIYLSATNVTIFLKQGGRAEALGEELTLDSTPQMFYEVELTEDHYGITARLPYVNMTVFFDGNTAQLSGNTAAEGGLCGNIMDPNITTSPSAEKSANYSDDGCDVVSPDTVNATIDCVGSAARCGFMGEAPFTDCHSHTSPDPYINACTTTSCQYPDVDGFICHYLEAYAKYCELIGAVVGDWRTEAGCSVVLQDACRDQYCSDHEFCGDSLGETHCLCRALFATTLDTEHPFDELTVCMENSASLTVPGCLLWEKGIDYSTLHLNDEACAGVLDDETHMVTFGFDGDSPCGAEVTTNDTHIVYRNTLVTMNTSSDVINRYEHVEVNFSCIYVKSDTMRMSIRIRDSSVVQHITTGVWNYTASMNIYTDPARQTIVEPNTEILMNQRIWIDLTTEDLDSDMVAVVTDSCWATLTASPNDTMRYDLIVDGCPNPADGTVEMEGNGEGLSNYFSFNVFEFLVENSEIYLHCKLDLCPIQEQSCTQVCGVARRRRSSRSKYADGDSAYISMVLNN